MSKLDPWIYPQHHPGRFASLPLPMRMFCWRPGIPTNFYTPENLAFWTQKLRFGRWCSCSNRWCSGVPADNFRGKITNSNLGHDCSILGWWNFRANRTINSESPSHFGGHDMSWHDTNSKSELLKAWHAEINYPTNLHRWWFNGELPWQKVKNHIKQTKGCQR